MIAQLQFGLTFFHEWKDVQEPNSERAVSMDPMQTESQADHVIVTLFVIDLRASFVQLQVPDEDFVLVWLRASQPLSPVTKHRIQFRIKSKKWKMVERDKKVLVYLLVPLADRFHVTENCNSDRNVDL